MQLYIELWNPRPEWLALDADGRERFLARSGEIMRDVIEAGAELVGFVVNDGDALSPCDSSYAAVWRMPTSRAVEKLEECLIEAGWHEYFDQVNLRGDLISPREAADHMAKAE